MSVRRWRQESTPRSARNFRALRELRERSPHNPMIIDAGIGLPSRACQAMEWGFDGRVFQKLKRRRRGREKAEELPGMHSRVD
jgi:hypothetical protein